MRRDRVMASGRLEVPQWLSICQVHVLEVYVRIHKDSLNGRRTTMETGTTYACSSIISRRDTPLRKASHSTIRHHVQYSGQVDNIIDDDGDNGRKEGEGCLIVLGCSSNSFTSY